jgi:hypothetical protein
MNHNAAVIFTAKGTQRILREGGTSSWRLNPKNARQCAYAVCTRNAHASLVEGSEAHHSAFLVGKVRSVVTSPTEKNRYLIQFSEFARVAIPEVWKGDRNPVRYSTLEELGIDPSILNWEAMPAPDEAPAPTNESPLTFAEARKGLALTYGVALDAIEITIHG